MDARDIRALLASHPFFEDLRTADLDRIAGCGVNVRFRPGQTLFEEGDPADAFYVVRRGKVAIETRAPSRPPFVVATNRAGDVVGWSWLFPPHRWSFDARAIEDTGVIALDGTCLRQACDTDIELGYRLVRRFARLAITQLTETRLRLLDVYGPAGEGHGRV
jgi:CRP/FNR family transcriptional regulator, cyclic AMP receptor protein